MYTLVTCGISNRAQILTLPIFLLIGKAGQARCSFPSSSGLTSVLLLLFSRSSSMENKEDQHGPSKIPYELLKHITDDFASDRIVGAGGYGTVYKGMPYEKGKVIAVKKLHNSSEIDDEMFSKEFDSLMGLKHPNIVRLLGFCSEKEIELAEFYGKQVATTRTHRALCFDYEENGSLDNHISEEHDGFNWTTRYNIIKGVCEGLKYLREEKEYPIYHLDLKPSNILLDTNMSPKITDFGLSRLCGEQTTLKTMNSVGTCGYWPPEYIKHQIISREFDIYSLGVIILKTMTGHDGYQHIADKTNTKILHHVYGNWRKRLHRTINPRLVEVYSTQVKTCIKLAMDCMRSNRQERPTIQEIVSSLNQTEIMYNRDDGESTQPSRITSIAHDSRPFSDTPASQDGSIGTPGPADHSTFSSSAENKAHHEPNKLPYHLIKRITNDFHKDRIVGRGGFGTVYKGVHEKGEEIAVKVLHRSTGLDDEEFRKEFNNLKRLKHQNVVEFVGYCSEEEEELVEIHGKQVSAVRIRLALCFEYVHNGNLEKYITDEHMRFDWPTRYKIINGICEGLKYLHEKLIVHCDLKPGNILLDKNKMAKIADFGLAKLFGEENTKKTMSSLGTRGYQPPEFIDRQIISKEFDIYSLGVIIIKIMTGHEGYNSGLGTLTPNSVNLVYESWMKKLPETSNQKLYGRQVKTCIEIAIDCLKTNRNERPTIGEIVSRLKKQYYQYEGDSTHFSRITINSGPSSGHGEASSIATHTENFWGVEPSVYMTPQHGSCLDRYISDTSSGLDWQTRYRIKKGICDGVKHLHEGSSSPIIHMNLKTSNILLDEKMVLILGDFVMTRLAGEESVTKTMSMTGTIEHMPPEFIEKQVISKEFDIYSLGVLFIKVMTGERLYSEHSHMSSMDFIELAHGKWRERLQETMCLNSAEGYCKQVRKCLEIAFKCMEPDRRKRPTIGNIIDTLSETETKILPEQINLDLKDSELLIEDHPMELLIDVQPLELRFQFMPPLRLPRKKDISCLLQLNNRGNDRVAFMVVANNPKKFLTKKPLCGVVSQRSTYTLTLIMPKQPQSLHEDDFFTLYSIAVDGYDLQEVNKGSIANEYGKFFKKAKETACQQVQEVILKVICCQEDNDQGNPSAEPKPPAVEITTTPDAQQVSSIDVHPDEPWIMTTSRVGRLHVWDYRTMTPLNSFGLAAYEPVHEAKFIARVKWLLAGDRSGGIHVYSYDQNKHVKSFDAHDSRIATLAVHPTRPITLSSSLEDDDHLIKLWDWGNGWKCTRTFQGHTDRVTQVTFNPEDEDSFVSASWDGTVKIWSICSDDPKEVITLNLDRYAVESLLCVDYFTRRDRQHLIVGCRNKTAQILNLGIKGCVHEVEGHADRITAVNLHPMLPVLITASLDGTVCIWNSITYKLQNTINFNLGAVYAFGCIKGSTRIVVGCDQGIATVDISSP